MADQVYTDEELAYACSSRCRCGAGLAHPLSGDKAMDQRAWVCSAVLRGEAGADMEHDVYPFALYEVKSEFQPSACGLTTRPEGTTPALVPECYCPQCGSRWKLEAVTPPRLVPAGPCPNCGNANGSNLSARYGNGEPPAIETRFRSAVLKGAQDGRREAEGEPPILARRG